jgi:hypothetical protein
MTKARNMIHHFYGDQIGAIRELLPQDDEPAED